MNQLPPVRNLTPYSLRHSLLRCLAPLLLVAGCSTSASYNQANNQANNHANIPTRLEAALPADILLLGEQHDAAEHQQIHQQVVQNLARNGRLAALALEMADAGTSTAALARNSSEDAVQQALQWSDKSWPWKHYGAAVMAAVQAGVPVLGANLPRAQMRAAMADTSLDTQLPAVFWQAQQQAIRSGHCDLLPEAQIVPMARIQIAKDLRMANTLVHNVHMGQVVVLLAGSGHVDRRLGVPSHLKHLAPSLRVSAIRLLPQEKGDTPPSALPNILPNILPIGALGAFDAVWPTPPVPTQDYCATLRPPSMQAQPQP